MSATCLPSPRTPRSGIAWWTALNASGAQTDYAPLPLISAMNMAETAIAHLGRGRIVNPPKYTARDWDVPAGADA